MNTDNLTGTYRLLSWENRHASGETSYPLGPDAKGIISYSADGCVFVHIMAANRKAHSVGDLLGGQPREIVESATTHISYCGTYRIEGDEVVHNIQICSFPNWVSTEQRRRFEFVNGNLTLSAKAIQIGTESVEAHLIWQPIGNQSGV